MNKAKTEIKNTHSPTTTQPQMHQLEGNLPCLPGEKHVWNNLGQHMENGVMYVTFVCPNCNGIKFIPIRRNQGGN